MDHKTIEITFVVTAQRHDDGQFSLPKPLARELGLGSGDPIRLTVSSTHGTWTGASNLRSGLEIYGPELRNVVRRGERVRASVATTRDVD